MNRKHPYMAICLMLASAVLTGCGPVSTPHATSTPRSALTPSPTHTPYPTPTSTPTPTLTPTPTATPTVTPTPTPTPTLTPTATPTPDISALLLQTMHEVNQNLLSFGGLMDAAVRSGELSPQEIVSLYDIIVNAPTYDVSHCDAVTQRAYEFYREAIRLFSDGARDLAEAGRGYLNDPDSQKGGSIPRQQFGLARQRTNDAQEPLNQAIRWLEQR